MENGLSAKVSMTDVAQIAHDRHRSGGFSESQGSSARAQRTVMVDGSACEYTICICRRGGGWGERRTRTRAGKKTDDLGWIDERKGRTRFGERQGNGRARD